MSVEQRVKQIIVEQLGVDENQVDNSASFVDDLGADSLDIVEFVFAVQEQFKVNFESSEFDRLKTLEDLIAAVTAKLNSGATTKPK